MDDAIIAVYEKLAIRFRASADEILENPELRTLFLVEVRQSIGHLPERDILHRLTHLRKKGQLTRSRDLAAKSNNHIVAEEGRK